MYSTLSHHTHPHRLATLQEAHLTETSRLQQSLQQETERRETAEKMAEELKGEVAISMEDMGPGGGESSAQPQNFSECTNIHVYIHEYMYSSIYNRNRLREDFMGDSFHSVAILQFLQPWRTIVEGLASPLMLPHLSYVFAPPTAILYYFL